MTTKTFLVFILFLSVISPFFDKYRNVDLKKINVRDMFAFLVKRIFVIILLLCCLITLIFVIWGIDWGALDGSMTAYGIFCPKDYKEGNGCYALGTTTYYPNSNNQTVIVKTNYSIETLKKCSVINKENWECKYNDESATFGFVDGSFHNTSLSNKLREVTVKESIKEIEEYRYVPRWLWLIEQWNII